jgi:hypothetical protein
MTESAPATASEQTETTSSVTQTAESSVRETPAEVKEEGKVKDPVIPATLGEAASRASESLHAVTEEKVSFDRLFEIALAQKAELIERQKQAQEILEEGRRYLDECRRILVEELKIPQAEVEAKVQVIRTERERELMTQDYAEIRRFIQASQQTLEQAGKNAEGLTEYQAHQRLFEKLTTPEQGGIELLRSTFATDVHTLLSNPDDAKRAELKRKLREEIEKTVPAGQRAFYRSKIRNVMDGLRLMEGNHGTRTYSTNAIAGIMGRTLSDQEMQDVFDGKVDSIQNLPSGRVRVTFADQTKTFYHQQGEGVPADIVELTTRKLPSHILMVDYTTDDDVKKLLADMSGGQTMHALHCDSADCIVIEGRTEDDDFVMLQGPKTLKKEEFAAAPMRYLGSNLTFEGKKEA